MTAFLELSGVRELAVFAGDAAGAVGIQLNAKVLDDDPAVPPADPEGDFAAYLRKLPNLRFAPYRFDAADGELKLLAGATWLEPVGTDPSDQSDAIMTWLRQRVAANGWISIEDAPAELEPDGLDASQLLGSAQTWIAPLPQSAGLTRLLKIDPAGWAAPVVIVPFTEADAGDDPEPTVPAARIEAQGVVGYAIPSQGDGGTARRVFEILEPIDETLLVDETGFLRVPPDAEHVRLLLMRIRARAATLFCTAPHLLRREVEGDAEPTPDVRLRRLIWRGMSALASFADTLLLSLTMAGRERQGPFVAALIAEIAGRFDNEPDRTGDLADFITGHLRSRIYRPGQDQAARQRFVELIGQILDIKPGALPPPPKEGDDPAMVTFPAALPILLTLFRDRPETGSPLNHEGFLIVLEQRLDQELAQAADRLESEAGIEQAALAVLGSDTIRAEIDRLWGATKGEEAIEALRQRLAGPFNGLDAARHAVGELVQTRLLARARALAGAGLPGWAELAQALDEARWLTERPALTQGGSLATLAEWLPAMEPGLLTDDEMAAWVARLDGIQQAIAADLKRGIREHSTRFVADEAPQPLAIPIAVDQDSSDSNAFSLQYDGLAVLIRRGGGRWAHGNLARIVAPAGYELPLTLLPLQPVEADGLGQLHLRFEGFPFAARNLGPEEASESSAGIAYYDYLEPVRDELNGKQPLYGLAFGADYEVTAFAISRSGALPRGVGEGELPWRPVDDPTVPADGGGNRYRQTIAYRRKTSIGSASFERRPDENEVTAQLLKEIKSLSGDYPRLGYAAPSGGQTGFDLWRATDGAGTLPIPADGDKEIIELVNVRAVRGAGRLELALLHRPTASVDDFTAVWQVAINGPVAAGKLSLVIERRGLELECTLQASPENGWTLDSAAAVTLPLPDGPLWLRARLKGAGQPVGLSFDDPTSSRSAVGGAGRLSPASFVLLAPQAPAWRDDVPNGSSLKLLFPRISFPELDRWLANPELLRLASPDGSRLVRVFHERLLAAHIDAPRAEAVGDRLTSIPDPAVTALRLRLRPLDGLERDGTLGARLDRLVSEIRIDIPPLERMLAAIDGETPIATANMRSVLEGLHKQACRVVSIACTEQSGPALSQAADRSLSVTVPPGTVARLSVDRVVDRRLIDDGHPQSAFDPRMKELASDAIADSYLFGGPAMTIETMIEPPADRWHELASTRIRIRKAGALRRYDLIAGEKQAVPDPHWQHLGRAEVTTQRWRFMGRPIYRWIRPREEGPYDGVSPAVPLREGPAVEAFEGDIFFDRDPGDADTAQPVDLEPVGFDTVLQAVPWDEPSATLFRHRVALIGRYAAALADPRRARFKANARGTGLGDWIRVAMLADPTRVQLPRPQLRALLPLTAAPEEAGTPPVLAMLEEPPFAFGGLAERMAAEIRTSYGYEFVPPSGDDMKLGIADSRKEAGPDPRLTYECLPNAIGLSAALGIEGPIGLTFDSATSAPAMPNCAYLLTPSLLIDGEADRLEEHFLSVSLRRCLDPEWVSAEKRPVKLAQPAWFFATGSATLTLGERLILKVVKENGAWKIYADRQAVMPESSTTGPIEIATIAAGRTDRIAVLHQPLEEGRHAAILFALPTGAEAVGNANLPQAAASLEWTSKRDEATDLHFRDIEVTGGEDRILSEHESALPAAASPLTSLNWVRTGRDNRYVAAWSGDQDGGLARADVRELRLAGGDGGRTLTLQNLGGTALSPRSSLLGALDPLYVHRHLALLATEKSGGGGRPLEIYRSAHLMIGRKARCASVSPRHLGRLVEIEVPARPLGADAPLPEFAAASFDLKAIVPAGSGGESAARLGADSLTFWIRPLGRARRFAADWSLEFTLAADLIETVPDWTAQVRLAVGQALDEVDLVVLRVPVSPSPAPARAWVVTREGDRVAAGPAVAVPQLPELERLAAVTIRDLRVRSGGAPFAGEWWSDVSMLTTSVDDDGTSWSPPLSWGWLFTGSPDSVPGTAVTHRALRAMTEAQARILTISPPIPMKE